MDNPNENAPPIDAAILLFETQQIKYRMQQMQEEMFEQENHFDQRCRFVESQAQFALKCVHDFLGWRQTFYQQLALSRYTEVKTKGVQTLEPWKQLFKRCRVYLKFTFTRIGSGVDMKIRASLDLVGKTFLGEGLDELSAQNEAALKVMEFLHEVETSSGFRFATSATARLYRVYPNVQYIFEPYRCRLQTVFTVGVAMDHCIYRATGQSKRKAKNAAAKVVLEALGLATE